MTKEYKTVNPIIAYVSYGDKFSLVVQIVTLCLFSLLKIHCHLRGHGLNDATKHHLTEQELAMI